MPFNGSNPRSIIIMDNASIHHVEDVVHLIEQQIQAKIIFLPPYSPDLNPTEFLVRSKESLKQMMYYFKYVAPQEHYFQCHLAW